MISKEEETEDTVEKYNDSEQKALDSEEKTEDSPNKVFEKMEEFNDDFSVWYNFY